MSQENKLPNEFKSLNYLVEPKEKWIRLSKPTSDLINRLLASAKSCEEDSLSDIDYAEMAHDAINTFIKQPIPSGI